MKKTLIPLLLCAGQALAQTSGESRDATLRKLLERVESLETEVRQLRAEKTFATSASGKQTVAFAEGAVAAMDDAPARGTFPQLKLRGFGDVEYRWADGGENRNALRLGALDLFITSQLSENLSVLSENVIEADDEEHFGFEIERLVLQYTPREYFNVAVGRYHTAIGYYNNAYHHGKWLQTAAERPHLFDFEDEGGLLPIHNVGVSVSGAIPSGRLGLRYVAEVGNGRKYEPGEEAVQNVSDNNNFKAVNLALTIRPDWLPGLQAGVSGYFDRLSQSLAPTTNQTIVSAHVVYLRPEFEWLTEGVLMHDSSDRGSFNTFGFYTQIARRFGQFRPYVRYEYLNESARDPIVLLAGEPGIRQMLLLGVRYDFAEFAALKLELDRALVGTDDGARNEVKLQLSFTF